jgi:hypothetical protein
MNAGTAPTAAPQIPPPNAVINANQSTVTSAVQLEPHARD